MPSHLQRSYDNWVNWEKLPGEFPNGDKIQLCLFVTFSVAWIVDFIFKGTTWLNQYIPLGFRLFFGLSLILISYFLVKQSEADLFFHPCSYNEPVQFGLYQYCRHPMYLGVIIFHIGFGLISLSLISWVFIFITVKFYNFLANYEERKLIEKFDFRYQKYMEIVPKWIPKVRKNNYLKILSFRTLNKIVFFPS